MAERTITNWAGTQLDEKLSGLQLCPGVTTGSALDGGFMSGDVSVGERKGKSFPIYAMEVEVPFSGNVDGKAVSGVIHLPDVSMEMLDDLEVEVKTTDGDDLNLDAEVMMSAVRGWASEIRKYVAENAANLEYDPPQQTQAPRAAADISEEEAMSAGGAAARDDAEDDEDVEDVPRQDEEGEEEPFTEEEVAQMLDEVKEALREAFPGEEGEQQVAELSEEYKKAADVQEKGRMLMDVMDYLQNPPEGEEGEEGAEPADGEEGEEGEPYPGEEGLQELWKEVIELCQDEDRERLEDEMKGKSGEEQWSILLDVRDYLLNGDEEEQQAFNDWSPSASELEAEWKTMLKQVPKEEVKEISEEWKGANAEDKKRMVWDVRKFLQQQDEEEEGEEPATKGPPPKGKPPPKGPPPSVDDPEMGGTRNEVRRRGARRGAEYEENYEYDVPGGNYKDSGEWDEYYRKEAKRSRGRSPVVIVAGAMLLGALVVMLTAAATAEEDESVFMSTMRLLRLASKEPAAAKEPELAGETAGFGGD